MELNEIAISATTSDDKSHKKMGFSFEGERILILLLDSMQIVSVCLDG